MRVERCVMRLKVIIANPIIQMNDEYNDDSPSKNEILCSILDLFFNLLSYVYLETFRNNLHSVSLYKPSVQGVYIWALEFCLGVCQHNFYAKIKISKPDQKSCFVILLV